MYPPKLLLLFIFSILFSCTKKTPDKLSAVPDKNTIKEQIKPVEKELGNRKNLPEVRTRGIVASLKKTPCYGKCPVYEIKFTENQYVLWRGYENTERIGYFEAKLPGKVLEQIKQKVRQENLFELEDFYPQQGEFLDDYPAVITHIYSPEGLEQRTVHVYDAPRGLKEFEDLLIESIKNLQWTEIVEVD